MADDRYDYYSNNPDRDPDRERGPRDREAWLDNRTGVGARGRGYRAEFRDERGRQESRSFRPDDYGVGGEQGRSYRSYPENIGEGRTYGGTDDPYREDYRRGGAPSFSGEFGFGRDLSGGYNSGPTYSSANEPPYPYQPDNGQREPSSRMEGRRRGFWDRTGDTFAAWMGDDAARARHEADKRASHQGKGPKGYKRSDARIQEDLNDRLTDDHWLDASHIDVKVENGEVTLNGHVASRDDKRHAERLAEGISGVDHVQNNLRIDKSLASSQQVDDGVHSPLLDEQARGRH